LSETEQSDGTVISPTRGAVGCIRDRNRLEVAVPSETIWRRMETINRLTTELTNILSD
jgi:hypothetical protein